MLPFMENVIYFNPSRTPAQSKTPTSTPPEPPPAIVNTDCIKFLEDMLAQAKSGELIGVAIAAEYSDKGVGYTRTGSGWVTSANPMLILAEITLLKQQYAHNILNGYNNG